ncbi:MAG: chemotaxis protein CheD, partial [Bdellovibrionales bacterium RIFOXYD1_FULL_53_11]
MKKTGNLVVVGISGFSVSNDPDTTIVTYSLGSCVGVSLYDPVARVGGLLHAMLPSSSSDPAKAETNPAMFVDTGMVSLLGEMLRAGADKSRILCKVAGGGSPVDDAGMFKIGERNFAVLRKFLWKNGIMIKGQDVGGREPRTVILDIGTG